MKISFLLLFVIFCSIDIYAQNNITTELPIELYDPEDIFISDSTSIVIYDPASEKFPLISYSLLNKEIQGQVLWGRGPGEIGGNFYKTITKGPNNTVSVFDRNLARVNIYKPDLTLHETLNFSFLKRNPMQAGFLSDSTFFVIPVVENFIQLHKVTLEENKNKIESTPFLTIKNNDSEHLKSLDNFLLKQDVHIKQFDESLFLSFDYGSLVLSLDNNGVNFEVFDPQKFPFPDLKPESGGVYSLPDVANYPVCNLDIDITDDFIFVLNKGEKADKFKIIKKIFSPGSILEELKHSDTIFVFNSNTGEFIEELKLPMKVSKIEIIDNDIYMLSSYKEEAKLYKLTISDLMNYQLSE